MATLIINMNESYCGDCGNGCYYQEKAHITRLGYDPGDGKGCGAILDAVSSEYYGAERVANIRPDLEFVPINNAHERIKNRSREC